MTPEALRALLSPTYDDMGPMVRALAISVAVAHYRRQT